jgi:hypothetical protein
MADPQDTIVLEKLTSLFKKCFNFVKEEEAEKKADEE